MRLESSVNLLVSALDLKLVRLLRDAMRDGEGSAASEGANRLSARPTLEPRRRVHPEPVIEPRLHLRPEPAIDPRPVLHPARCECPVVIEVSSANKPSSGSPIQPPWKVLPWEEPPAESPRPVHKVKVVTGPPDTCSRGSVIDLFI